MKQLFVIPRALVDSILVVMLLAPLCTNASAAEISVKNYGHFKKMVHMNKTAGVVDLASAVTSEHSYAIGAIEQGRGEITIVDGDVWLDYGNDGIGNSLNAIPTGEQAVILVAAQVNRWQRSTISKPLLKHDLFKAILARAAKAGVDVKKPFPFLLEGSFSRLRIHVINGTNPKFGGHGGKEKFYKQDIQKRNIQSATIVGFYSAGNQGMYTHPGTSWHMHAVIKDENIGAHVDDIATNEGVTLKLPSQ